MRTVDLIRIKRDGGKLTSEQIETLIEGYVAGRVPEYQVAAWLMAVYLRGMSAAELAALTGAMMRSGDVYDLSSIPGVKADKHSTGGVGDKVSLILAPLAASCGLVVPMISGRGLGHTGGTLDKLESIPGFTTRLSKSRFMRQLRRIGVAMGGQTARFVPADRKLYALRDVTSTVESIPLICASIMSKKLAEGCDALVLDVKTGNGAFMARPSDALRLARTLVRIGRGMGRRVSAMVTDMSQPLGRAVGNANEVAESIACLKGAGPSDLMTVTRALVVRMLTLTRTSRSEAEAGRRVDQALESGAALEKFRALIEAQDGDPRCIDDPSRLPRAPKVQMINAPRSGYLGCVDTRSIGTAAMILGAGRAVAGDDIDPAVGLLMKVKVGERLSRGQPIIELHYRDRTRFEQARALLKKSLPIVDEPVRPPRLIRRREV